MNVKVGGVEIPLGLGLITLTLFALCVINLFTKQVATVSGVVFTGIFFAVFQIAEKYTQKSESTVRHDLDQFNVEPEADLSPATVGARPGNVLVMVRNSNALYNLSAVLEHTDTHRQDIVALHMRLVPRAASGEHELVAEQLFSIDEQQLFTRALALAEARGKTIHLAVAPAVEKWTGILLAAQSLQSTAIALGLSARRAPGEEARVAGLAWEVLPEPRPELRLEIYTPEGNEEIYYLGPHAPRLTPKELDLLHRLWLELSQDVAPAELHHRDVVHFALDRLRGEMSESPRDKILEELKKHLAKHKNTGFTGPETSPLWQRIERAPAKK